MVPTGSPLGPVSEFLISRVRVIRSTCLGGSGEDGVDTCQVMHTMASTGVLGAAILGLFLTHVLLLGTASQVPSVWPEMDTCRVVLLWGDSGAQDPSWGRGWESLINSCSPLEMSETMLAYTRVNLNLMLTKIVCLWPSRHILYIRFHY